MTSLLLAFGMALVVALLVTPLSRRLAVRLGAVDHADGQRKFHPRPVPRLGGVALYLALVLAAVVCGQGTTGDGEEVAISSGLTPALLLSGGLACLTGCWDDLRGLRVRWKMFGLVLAALPLALSDHGITQVSVGNWTIPLGCLQVPLTIGWLVACANALNFLDGMDGLAATIGQVVAVLLALIALSQGHVEVGLLALALAGGLTGFLSYNWRPATVYLGDGGSLLLGLVLGALAMSSTREQSGESRLAVLLALLALPLADLGLAIVRRTWRRRWFWLADCGHIHHRLLGQGMPATAVVFSLAAVSLITGGLACLTVLWGSEAFAWGALAGTVLACGWVVVSSLAEVPPCQPTCHPSRTAVTLIRWRLVSFFRFRRGVDHGQQTGRAACLSGRTRQPPFLE
jgi:UDP-GlcNAc:undecaprenyl-phosphate GlcNAc-1-phosphate transferase